MDIVSHGDTYWDNPSSLVLYSNEKDSPHFRRQPHIRA